MSFAQLAEPTRSRCRVPVFALGFRPFFLLAALFAAISVPVWVLVYQGLIEPNPGLPPGLWHAHEMIFGFVVAVIAGFLLTAASNWAGQPTARGWSLAALVGLWLAGRASVFCGFASQTLAAAIDISFLPILAITIAVPLLRVRNRNGVIFPLLLLALSAINTVIHLSALGLPSWDAQRATLVAIDVILLMIAVLGGRVIPSFTANALPRASVKPCPKASALALASILALALADAAASSTGLQGAIALVAGILNALRMRGWGSTATLRTPILWILHLGYGWLATGLILRGLSGLFGLVANDAGLHAIALGAIGSMILGMMSRVSLGHTGRPIHAAKLTIAAYVLVNLAAITRVIFPMASQAFAPAFLIASATLWSLGFSAFLIVYLPILMRSRVDGRPG